MIHARSGGGLRPIRQLISLGLVFALLFLVSCQAVATAHALSLYGSYGSDLARNIAGNYPVRVAGTSAETQTADLIFREFETLGYVPERQTFSLPDGASSSNIIVRIPGSGFVANESRITELDYSIYGNKARPEDGLFTRQVIVGARYDTDPAASAGADGVSDNASGIGALLTLAQELKRARVGYDVILVAFGGGFANEAGSSFFVNSLNAEDRAITDTFYEFRSLVGGAKLYANAGLSSLYPNKKYILRQPLYEVATIALSEEVLGRSGVALYQNQSTFLIPNPLAGETAPGADYGTIPENVVFREISSTRSDYRAFDRIGIACVLFESSDFNAKSYDELKENPDPNYASTNYLVRGTDFDSIASFDQLAEADLIQQRINVSAFLVLRAIENGVLGSDSP